MNVALSTMAAAQRSAFVNYLDDLNGGVGTFDALVSAYRALLAMCSDNKITLKASKTKVGFPTCNAGGFELGNGVRKLADKHMAPLLALQPPTNVSELRRVLGLFVQLNNMVPHFATTARPLSRLTGKVPWRWGELEQKAFDTLKSITCARPSVAAPDYTKKLYLDTDASEIGHGYMLYQ